MPWEANRRRSFSRLVTDELYAALWRYACRLCRTPADAEDLLQESLVRGYERLDQLLAAGNIRAWLFRVMYSVFVNRYHYELSRPAFELLDQAATSPATAEHELEVAAVRRAVRGLPDLQRQAVEFFYFDELSLEEIAAVMRTNVNSVKQRLFRARRELRRQLLSSRPAAGERTG